jgi:hypothetical protein
MKPNIFIGSSVESLQIAYALQQSLEFDANITVWTQGIFKLSGSALVDLINSLTTFQFAIFVFSPDDISIIRNNKYVTTRDNVIFELGLFMGKLGKDQVFFLVPRDINDFHLPTDLLGITAGTYDNNRADNLLAALGPFCNQVRNVVKQFKYDNIDVLKLETREAKQLAIERPRCWEYLLFSELLASRISKTDRLLVDLETETIFIKTNALTGLEFFQWYKEAITDLKKITIVTSTLFLNTLTDALKDEEGDIFKLKYCAEKFDSLAKELLKWTQSLYGLEVPAELDEVKRILKGWAIKMYQEIKRLPQEMRRVTAEHLGGGVVNKISFSFNVAELKDINKVDLFTEYFKKTGKWPED